jgi:RimJ/RimL family protein N-acetyltransferase
MQYVGAPLPTEEELTQTILKSTDSSDNFLIGAFSSDRLIGLVNLRRERADHPWVKHIGNFGMMILKEFWGQGIGKKLLKILDDTAKDAGITRIQGEVRTQNLRGVNLYKKSGYQIEGTRINAAFIDGSFQDCFYIAKNVPETQKCDWQPPVLETARLILRPLAMTDAAHIFNYAKNPNVSRTTLWDPHTSIEDSKSLRRPQRTHFCL